MRGVDPDLDPSGAIARAGRRRRSTKRRGGAELDVCTVARLSVAREMVRVGAVHSWRGGRSTTQRVGRRREGRRERLPDGTRRQYRCRQPCHREQRILQCRTCTPATIRGADKIALARILASFGNRLSGFPVTSGSVIDKAHQVDPVLGSQPEGTVPLPDYASDDDGGAAPHLDILAGHRRRRRHGTDAAAGHVSNANVMPAVATAHAAEQIYRLSRFPRLPHDQCRRRAPSVRAASGTTGPLACSKLATSSPIQ